VDAGYHRRNRDLFSAGDMGDIRFQGIEGFLVPIYTRKSGPEEFFETGSSVRAQPPINSPSRE
jgi:hypothetical protein